MNDYESGLDGWLKSVREKRAARNWQRTLLLQKHIYAPLRLVNEIQQPIGVEVANLDTQFRHWNLRDSYGLGSLKSAIPIPKLGHDAPA